MQWVRGEEGDPRGALAGAQGLWSGETIGPFERPAWLQFKVAVTHLLLTLAAPGWQRQRFYRRSQVCSSLWPLLPLLSSHPPSGRREPVVRATGREGGQESLSPCLGTASVSRGRAGTFSVGPSF